MFNCVFCKIVSKQIDSAVIWENEEFIAVLDINPNTPGMALVLTKQHYDSYAFALPKEVYKRFMGAAKTVAEILEKGLDVKRVAMVVEGLGVDHAHIKLYPLHGLEKQFVQTNHPDHVFFQTYPGYLTTQLGPQANLVQLKSLANKLKKFMDLAKKF